MVRTIVRLIALSPFNSSLVMGIYPLSTSAYRTLVFDSNVEMYINIDGAPPAVGLHNGGSRAGKSDRTLHPVWL